MSAIRKRGSKTSATKDFRGLMGMPHKPRFYGGLAGRRGPVGNIWPSCPDKCAEFRATWEGYRTSRSFDVSDLGTPWALLWLVRVLHV